MILSDATTAAVLSDLSQGRSVETVASKHHLDVSVVEQIRDLYGPDRAHLTAASRALYMNIRTAPSEEPASDPKNRRYHDAGPRLEQTDIKVPFVLASLAAPGPEGEPDAAPTPETEVAAEESVDDEVVCTECGTLTCKHFADGAGEIAPDVAAVGVECPRCGEPVAPGDPIGTWKANGEPICATCYRDQDDPLPTPTSAPLVLVLDTATGDAYAVASEVGQAFLDFPAQLGGSFKACFETVDRSAAGGDQRFDPRIAGAALFHFRQAVTHGFDQQLEPRAVFQQVVFQVGVALDDPDVAQHLEQHARGAAGTALGPQFVQGLPGRFAQQAHDDFPVGKRGVVVGDFAQTRCFGNAHRSGLRQDMKIGFDDNRLGASRKTA